MLGRAPAGAPAPVEAFATTARTSSSADTLDELVAGMNELTAEPLLDLAELARQIVARDRELDNSFSKDAQVMAIRNARRYLGDRIVRTASPHKLLDPAAGPLIAVRLQHPDPQDARRHADGPVGGCVGPDGRAACPGLYAAGEVGRFRRRRGARLPVAGGHVPRRVPVLRPPGGPGHRPGDRGLPPAACAGTRPETVDRAVARAVNRAAGTVPAMTGLQPEFWVDRPVAAVGFYTEAFGATVLHQVGEGEDIVAQLAVGDAAFWVSAADPDAKRFDPAALGGGTGRTLLVVDDPDGVFARALAAGAVAAAPVSDEHGWRLGRIIDPFGHEGRSASRSASGRRLSGCRQLHGRRLHGRRRPPCP